MQYVLLCVAVKFSGVYCRLLLQTVMALDQELAPSSLTKYMVTENSKNLQGLGLRLLRTKGIGVDQTLN